MNCASTLMDYFWYPCPIRLFKLVKISGLCNNSFEYKYADD